MSTPADDSVLRLARDRQLLRTDQVAAVESAIMTKSEAGLVPSALSVLAGDGLVESATLSQAISEEIGLRLISLREIRIAADVLELVPREIAVRHQLVPISRRGDVLRVAISDPVDCSGVDDLSRLTGLVIEPELAAAEEISAAIAQNYRAGPTALEQLVDGLQSREVPELQVVVENHADESPVETAGDAPIVNLVHSILATAVQRRASDIHIEPMERRVRTRFRVDGVLQEGDEIPKRLQLPVVSRLKIMANISIAEKRVPQDGRIQLDHAGRALDLRVSTLPTAHGESVVMRILDKEGLRLGLPELGLVDDQRVALERIVGLPDGIVLVTGPTGSGKTTTLYSCLHGLNKSDRKIITVEDPVEYQLTGINQVPVRHEIGMTFASALRAMLRQAPNVVMVGEIRDLETAEIAINASLTGHLVFSTLHTNDAPGAVTRLIDLGVKPYLVSASLRAVLAQRLVRKICVNCREPYTPDSRDLRALQLEKNPDARSMHGAGCSKCNGTGYRGRMGIFEIFRVDEEIQRSIHANVSAAHLRDRARAGGMRTMREDGVLKAIAGLTTVEEVVSITVGDSS